MKTCLGVVCGLFFLLAAAIFLLIFNLDRTVYNPTFVKNTARSSGFYQTLPGIVTDLVSKSETASVNGEVSPKINNLLIDSVKTALTPETLQRHFESLIDQTLSNKTLVTEDISDINTVINAKMGSGFSEMIGIPVKADSTNAAIPNSITFDKSQTPLGKSVIYHQKALWISLAASVLFLLLLFFASSRSYKSRLKWTGGFSIALAFFTALNYLILRLINIKLILTSLAKSVVEEVPTVILDQVIKIVDILKSQFLIYYLYELGLILIFAIVCLVISAFLRDSVTPTNSATINPAKVSDVKKTA